MSVKNQIHSIPEEEKDLIIKKARNGLGIFTRRKFLADETIFEVTGKFVTCDEDDNLDQKTRDNTYRYDEERYISPQGRIGDFLNHSCDPNAKVVKRNKKLFIVALCPIPHGVEVVFDYSTILASDDIWKMNCNCGSTYCRKVIKKFNSLPKQLQKKYISQDMVPSYILYL